MELRFIGCGELVANRWNRRKWCVRDEDDAELVELADDLERQGRNFQAVVVRPLPEIPDVLGGSGEAPAYEIVAGERRWRAARLSAARKRESSVTGVWCEVRELTDAEAFSICVAENKRRKPLGPMEEAETIALYLSTVPGSTLAEAANEMGVSRFTAARRLALQQLAACWRGAWEDAEHPAHGWSTSHFEAIARLDASVQERVYKGFQWDNPYQGNATLTLAGLQARLDQERRPLSAAPWKLSDKKLVAAAGSCAACPKRSDKQPELWDDVGGKIVAHCLDGACFKEKLSAWREGEIAGAMAEYGGVLLLSGVPWQWHRELPGHTVERAEDYTEHPAGTLGAVAALDLDDGFRVCWVLEATEEEQNEDEEDDDETTDPAVLAEREAREAARAERALWDAAASALEKDLRDWVEHAPECLPDFQGAWCRPDGDGLLALLVLVGDPSEGLLTQEEDETWTNISEPGEELRMVMGLAGRLTENELRERLRRWVCASLIERLVRSRKSWTKLETARETVRAVYAVCEVPLPAGLREQEEQEEDASDVG